MLYRNFPKGDARRYFVVLAAIDAMRKSEATIHRVATAIGCTRAEALRAVHAVSEQFGVAFDRDGSAYIICSWGVLKKSGAIELAKSPLNDTDNS